MKVGVDRSQEQQEWEQPDPFAGPARHAAWLGVPLGLLQIYLTGKLTVDMPVWPGALVTYLSIGSAPYWGPVCVVAASKVGGWISGSGRGNPRQT
jgi:hypothetical protein